MAKKSGTAMLADLIAKRIVAEQTKARMAMSADAAVIAAHEAFGMGPGRAKLFAEKYNEALEWLADLFINDADKEGNGDRDLFYAKGKRDELIRSIVGDDFVPFDLAYGRAYIDELKRIRIGREEAADDQVHADGTAG